MRKTLQEKLELRAQLRKKRDEIKAEKSDLYYKALSFNDKIKEKRDELSVLYEKRGKIKDAIQKLLDERKALSRQVDAKRQEIKSMVAAKATMFKSCKEHKASIIEIEKQILAVQKEIDHLKGNDRDW